MHNHEAENLKMGCLLRIKEYCRKNITIRHNGEYGILAPSTIRKSRMKDVVFPSGRRCIFIPRNWEVLSESE